MWQQQELSHDERLASLYLYVSLALKDYEHVNDVNIYKR